ncbi:MAG: peroxide stress protein YaaA [Anaerovoracaceae bacterium]
MKIIISPAKKMNPVTDLLDWTDLPAFLPETERLLAWLRSRSFGALQSIWNCNDKIALLNYNRLQTMDLQYQLTPAVLAYEGLQYQHMAPQVMEYSQLDWLQEHLRILSGFYGLLRPLDGIVPYRLEMQARLTGFDTENLYDFWGRSLYDALIAEESDTILNLASKEYSRCITRYADTAGPQIITCVFGQLTDGKVREKGTFAKMARGDMVRFLAEHHVQDAAGVKDYQGLGYCFREDLSDEESYVFIK